MRRTRHEEAADDISAKREREQRRFFASKPKRIANVLTQLIQKRGLGRPQTDEQLRRVWEQVAGEALSQCSRPCRIRRGKLEVLVANSTALQQLSFERDRILLALQRQLPETRLRDLRLRIGRVH